VQNKSARRKRRPFRVTSHKEPRLWPLKGVQWKMVTAFWRIEAGREGFAVAQKLSDIGLSWILKSDDHSGRNLASVQRSAADLSPCQP
jgi:hypothetical protein